MECELLFPKCDPVLSPLWLLSNALHTDVAHVPAQVTLHTATATQFSIFLHLIFFTYNSIVHLYYHTMMKLIIYLYQVQETWNQAAQVKYKKI